MTNQEFSQPKLYHLHCSTKVIQLFRHNMSLKLKDPNTITYQSKVMRWEEEKEDMENVSDEAMDSSANVTKKKRRPTSLCIECPVCGGPAPDHLHFGGTDHTHSTEHNI